MEKTSRRITGSVIKVKFARKLAVSSLVKFIRGLNGVQVLTVAILFLLVGPATVLAQQHKASNDVEVFRIAQNRDDILKLREEAKKKSARVLHFPTNKSIGTIMLLDSRQILMGGGKQLGKATGNVNIPAGTFVELKMFYTASSDISLLKGLKPDDIDSLDFSGTDIDDKSLGAIERLSGIRCLWISDTDLTNAALAHVAKLSNLEQLLMNRTNITDLNQLRSLKHLQKIAAKSNKIDDAGAKCLCSFKTLRRVQLSQTLITDQTLKCLASLPNLIRIDANQMPQLTDRGMANLSAAKSLIWISLLETKITRHAFLELAKLPGLIYINVQNTKISKADILEFKKINKTCDIIGGTFVTKGSEAVHL